MLYTGSSVFNGPSYTNWLSANWDSDIRFKRSMDARAPPPCIAPDVIGYTTEKGEQRVVKVPEGAFGAVSKYVEGKEYKELAKLETYEGKINA